MPNLQVLVPDGSTLAAATEPTPVFDASTPDGFAALSRELDATRRKSRPDESLNIADLATCEMLL